MRFERASRDEHYFHHQSRIAYTAERYRRPVSPIGSELTAEQEHLKIHPLLYRHIAEDFNDIIDMDKMELGFLRSSLINQPVDFTSFRLI